MYKYLMFWKGFFCNRFTALILRHRRQCSDDLWWKINYCKFSTGNCILIEFWTNNVFNLFENYSFKTTTLNPNDNIICGITSSSYLNTVSKSGLPRVGIAILSLIGSHVSLLSPKIFFFKIVWYIYPASKVLCEVLSRKVCCGCWAEFIACKENKHWTINFVQDFRRVDL